MKDIKDITDQLKRNKQSLKETVGKLSGNDQARAETIKVIDNIFSSIVDGSVVMKLPTRDTVVAVSKNEISITSKSLTSIINKFYEIESNSRMLNDMRDAQLEAEARVTKENQLEGALKTPAPPEAPAIDSSAEIYGFLLQELPGLTERIERFTELLDNVKLPDMPMPEDDDLDLDDARRRRRRPSLGREERARPEPERRDVRARARPSMLSRLGAGLKAAAGTRTGKTLMIGGLLGAGAAMTRPGTISQAFTNVGRGISNVVGSAASTVGSLFNAGTSVFREVTGGSGAWKQDAPFIAEVNRVARNYNIDANDLLGLMQAESRLDPQAVNRGSGATGLIQFMPDTARALGTTTSALYGMDRVQQMAYVERYFAMNRLPRGATAGNLYASVFLPKYTNRPSNFVVARQGGPNDAGDNANGSWYRQNSGLDLNRDGSITIAELGQKVSLKRQEIGLGPSMLNPTGFQQAANIASNITGAIVTGSQELYNTTLRTIGMGGFIPPVQQGRVTSEFGMRRHPTRGGTRMHTGVDYGSTPRGRAGTPILASAPGVVTHAAPLGGYGNLVMIDHGNGYSTRYGHLNSISVGRGQQVQQGQYIGGMGTTGQSTGVHLHFEIRKNGTPVNPLPLLNGATSPELPQYAQAATEPGVAMPQQPRTDRERRLQNESLARALMGMNPRTYNLYSPEYRRMFDRYGMRPPAPPRSPPAPPPRRPNVPNGGDGFRHLWYLGISR